MIGYVVEDVYFDSGGLPGGRNDRRAIMAAAKLTVMLDRREYRMITALLGKPSGYDREPSDWRVRRLRALSQSIALSRPSR